jgi:uncharacterized protein YqeY
MELLLRLQNDMKTALKAGQKDRLGVIRMLLSDVKNIDIMPNEPTAEQVVEAYAKKLRKSVEEYQRVNRPDEVAKLQSEIAVVEEYLPKKGLGGGYRSIGPESSSPPTISPRSRWARRWGRL